MAKELDIINRGMRCLSENLGHDDAELFIATLLSDKFDYTEWRRSVIDNINSFDDLEELMKQHSEIKDFGSNFKQVI